MNRNRWNGSDAGKVIRSTTSASSKSLTRFGGTFRLSHVDSCSSFVSVSLSLSHMSQKFARIIDNSILDRGLNFVSLKKY
jgi:hypothetical protein